MALTSDIKGDCGDGAWTKAVESVTAVVDTGLPRRRVGWEEWRRRMYRYRGEASE